MKKFELLIKGNLFFGLVGIFVYLVAKIFIHPNLSMFDDQAYIVWEHAASKGLLPFRDIYFPYGLMDFYRHTNLFWQLIYFSYLFFLYSFFYREIKKIIKDNFLTVFIFLSTIAISHLLAGADNFSRYGLFLVGTCYCVNLLIQKKISSKTIFIIGALTSLVFVLINDQGIYLIAIFLITLFVEALITRKDSLKKKIFKFTRKSSFYIGGLGLGIFPYLIYLYFNNSLADFFVYFKYLSISTLYAKTPFIASLKILQNSFVFVVLSVSIMFSAFRIVEKSNFSRITIFQIYLIMATIILEFKNIIRLNYWQITFMGYLIFSVLMIDILLTSKRISKSKFQQLLIASFISLCLVFVGDEKMRYGFNNKEPNYSAQAEALEFVNTELGYDGPIFSFPSEPIFYKLNNQVTPYYFSVYEASPSFSQAKQIDFIIQNKIEYIVINSKSISTQDLVPDYIRSWILFRYIYSNFTPEYKVGNYIIAKKSRAGFMNGLTRIGEKKYSRYLANIDLQNLPHVYGNYIIRDTKDISWVKSNYYNEKIINLDTKSSALLLKSIDNNSISVKIKSSGGYSSTIVSKMCTEICAIDLKWIPMLYDSNNFIKLDFLSKNIEKIAFINNK